MIGGMTRQSPEKAEMKRGKTMSRFDSKVVIVTGAASGIGAATAKRFLDDGASVVLNDIRRDRLVETSSGFDPGRVLIHNGDVSDRKYLQAMVDETISRFDRRQGRSISESAVVRRGNRLEN